MVDTDWEDMKYANSPCKFLIFLLINFSLVWIKFIYFVMRGNEILLQKKTSIHDQNCSNSRFSIKALRIGSAVGVTGPVVFLEKGDLVHPRLGSTTLVN